MLKITGHSKPNKEIKKSTINNGGEKCAIKNCNNCVVRNPADAFAIWHEFNSSYKSPIISQYQRRLIQNISQIGNFHFLPNNSARGESLSSRKNRFFIKDLKKLKINTIIDLRDKYSSNSYPQLCKENDIQYFNFPIDSYNVPDKKIIEKLPEYFKIMNNGGYYIACAQGLHRTDIALAINYVLNPEEKEIPILYGHFRNQEFKFDDIARRLHSLKKELNTETLKKLGWGEDFIDKFYTRKKCLKKYNETFFSLTK